MEETRYASYVQIFFIRISNLHKKLQHRQTALFIARHCHHHCLSVSSSTTILSTMYRRFFLFAVTWDPRFNRTLGVEYRARLNISAISRLNERLSCFHAHPQTRAHKRRCMRVTGQRQSPRPNSPSVRRNDNKLSLAGTRNWIKRGNLQRNWFRHANTSRTWKGSAGRTVSGVRGVRENKGVEGNRNMHQLIDKPQYLH